MLAEQICTQIEYGELPWPCRSILESTVLTTIDRQDFCMCFGDTAAGSLITGTACNQA